MKTKVKGRCLENFISEHEKPEMSIGSPEELTPNQIAERAASDSAMQQLKAEGEDSLEVERGWRMLAFHVKCKPADPEPGFTPEELKVWASGWRVGGLNLDEDCPETDRYLQKLWMDGLAAGTRALMSLEKDDDVKRGKIQRLAKEVTDLAEMEKIWKAYKGNGGLLTFEGIEAERSYGLKWTNGMTAYRIVQKYKKIMRNKQKVA